MIPPFSFPRLQLICKPWKSIWQILENSVVVMGAENAYVYVCVLMEGGPDDIA